MPRGRHGLHKKGIIETVTILPTEIYNGMSSFLDTSDLWKAVAQLLVWRLSVEVLFGFEKVKTTAAVWCWPWLWHLPMFDPLCSLRWSNTNDVTCPCETTKNANCAFHWREMQQNWAFHTFPHNIHFNLLNNSLLSTLTRSSFPSQRIPRPLLKSQVYSGIISSEQGLGTSDKCHAAPIGEKKLTCWNSGNSGYEQILVAKSHWLAAPEVPSPTHLETNTQ